MTFRRPRIPAHYVLLAVLAAACKPNESGNIPCHDDTNCPSDYPQCLRTGAGAGKCTEAVTGTPALASSTIGVSPTPISGGDRPGISLALPAVAGNANLARKITLAIASGGGAGEPGVKSGGGPVAPDALGTTITVYAPPSDAGHSKNHSPTLKVTQEPHSTAT